MVKVGDSVLKRLTGLLSPKDAPLPKQRGVVVWIHPEQRFYVAEFNLGGVPVRECFVDEARE